MVEHWCEDWDQDHVDVVETGGAPGDGSFDVTEASDLQIGHGLHEVISSVGEEGQEGWPDDLWAALHYGPVRQI